MMKNFRIIIRNNSLFVKIFLVMVVSIVAVSVLITFSTIRMSSNLFMETFTITNTKVLNQIQEQFEDFGYSVVLTALDVQDNQTIKQVLTERDLNSSEANQAFYAIGEQMDLIYSDRLGDANLILAGENDYLFNMRYARWPVGVEELVEHQITEKTSEQPFKILYQYVSGDLTNGMPMIVATKALTEDFGQNIYGYMYISLPEEGLREFYQGYTSEGNSVMVVSGNGQVLSSNQQETVGSYAPELLALAKEGEGQTPGYRDVDVFGKEYMLLSSSLPELDIYLVNLIDKELVLGNLVNEKEVALISSVIVLLALLVVFLISRKMTNSLSRLVKQISVMAKYDFSKPVEEKGGYEARQIASAFNYMLNELQEHVEGVIDAQRKQQRAELEALQHQINPHFLYNTLTSIKFLVKEGKKEAAFDMIDALIPLLQDALGNVDETITVEQEAANIKNYVLINQTRYGDRIKVNTLISPDCLHYHLPKLVIQPFIENAFFHAFTRKKQGYIQVLIARRDDKLVCEVVDTGDGMVVEKMQRNKGKRQLFSGIGVRNVHERIQLLYGETYGVEISSELNKGTKVKVNLPLLDENTKDFTISKNNPTKRLL